MPPLDHTCLLTRLSACLLLLLRSYPFRFTHEEFMKRFKCLLPKKKWSEPKVGLRSFTNRDWLATSWLVLASLLPRTRGILVLRR
jgi:hypothetical protein